MFEKFKVTSGNHLPANMFIMLWDGNNILIGWIYSFYFLPDGWCNLMLATSQKLGRKSRSLKEKIFIISTDR